GNSFAFLIKLVLQISLKFVFGNSSLLMLANLAQFRMEHHFTKRFLTVNNFLVYFSSLCQIQTTSNYRFHVNLSRTHIMHGCAPFSTWKWGRGCIPRT